MLYLDITDGAMVTILDISRQSQYHRYKDKLRGVTAETFKINKPGTTHNSDIQVREEKAYFIDFVVNESLKHALKDTPYPIPNHIEKMFICGAMVEEAYKEPDWEV